MLRHSKTRATAPDDEAGHGIGRVTRRIFLLAAVVAGGVGAWLALGGYFMTHNVALYKTVRADSIYDERYPPQNAVDGDHANIESRWLSARTNSLDWTSTPHWIEIDLGQAYTITGIRFWTGAHGEYKWQPSDFVFQAFGDGDWMDVISETGNDNAVFERKFPPVETDRVRLVATRGTDIGALRLYEIEVLGY